jgi:Poxvirus A32 protein
MPELKRLSETRWTWNQVEDPYPQLPGCNGCFLGPSSSGKTTTLLALLTGPYAKAFSALHVFSPSVHLDSAWSEIKDKFAKRFEESSFNETWDIQLLEKILDAQKTKIQKLKAAKSRQALPQALIIIDDFADNPEVLHKSGGIFTTLFIRGRHFGLSTWVSSQKLSSVSTLARTNFRFMCVWRLRNAREAQSLFEELSAIYPIKVLYQMYNQAISDEDYSFWFVNLVAKKREDMFMVRFEYKQIYDDPARDPQET